MTNPKSNPSGDTSQLASLLGAVLGGHPAVQDHMEKTGQPMEQILGALLNAQSAGSSTQADAGEPITNLLGALMGGASSGNQANAGGDALGGILGALVGGSGAPSSQTHAGANAGADPMANMLGALLGGGGGGGSSLGSNAFLAPIVDSLAEKIGVDPKIAEVVVNFVLAKLLTAQTQGASSGSKVSGLIDRMGSGKPIDQKYLNSTGLTKELASQSGLDSKTAAQSLMQVINTFSKQMQT